MKSVDLSDEGYARLERLAAARKQTPAEIINALLGAECPIGSDPLLFPLRGIEFPHLPDPADRYLALLAWAARYHAADFSDFIAHQASARRYLRLSRAESDAVRQLHCTRQIDGTPYWAVMNIEGTHKSRFVRQLLEYVGCHEATIAETLQVLALTSHESHGQRPLLGAA